MEGLVSWKDIIDEEGKVKEWEEVQVTNWNVRAKHAYQKLCSTFNPSMTPIVSPGDLLSIFVTMLPMQEGNQVWCLKIPERRGDNMVVSRGIKLPTNANFQALRELDGRRCMGIVT